MNKDIRIGIDNNERKVVAVINGPNINILGVRDPQNYGTDTLANIEKRLKELAEELQINISFFQSNYEGAIVDFIQDNFYRIDGIVINPAAYTKTGYAILDALTAIDIPFIEVHLSNIFSREPWHGESIFSCKAVGHVIGLKGFGYELGLRGIVNYIK